MAAADDSEAPTLAPEEIERYARHIVLPEIGGGGQQRLKAAKVLIVGAGGLGSPAAIYLAASGIGTIGIVDDDEVSLSNLQRQILHASADLGTPKVESARKTLLRINPHLRVEAHNLRLTEENAAGLVAGHDLVLDGTDNFAARYLLAAACETARKPLVTAAVGRFDGSVTVLKPYEDDNPRFSDLFPAPPPEGLVPSCAEAGIVGALTGIVGSIQALEAIKLVAGFGEPLIGRLLLYDGLSQRFETIVYRRRSG
ncbi:molybdopterin-synthase adenylyltransferase MoeB [Afifella sp. IM 167]|uniref:molybdopterin-synthase adenylyltransferase MoeB n=1 Tax=Afifella sp. IM 167 TaxID=2033586 RepID=UPI001CCEFF4A|nr:molybdopterin-synthase adenylyltransferase MoeB [Afifella sp. IM 167]MBZ8133564.1 thiamine biosynthesis protein ThiF [Afifella sp. IM 167]